MISKSKKIYIAGHKGMVGSAILRKLKAEGFTNFVLRDFNELDLRNQSEVEKFIKSDKPKIVIDAAAKVGGIVANNTFRAEFIYDNLMIQTNIIHSSYKYGVEKLIFLGSSCIYPKLAPQPLKEEYLLSGYLEETNEPYALAKIAGIKMCENYYRQYGCNFYSVMPTNLYGPNDNYNLNTSHVLPALIRKFHEATNKDKIKSRNEKQFVEVWGSGKPRREFLHVDDLADAIYFLLINIDAKDIYDNGITHLNIGTGVDCSIRELAEIIKKATGFDGKIIFNLTKPDGTPRKLLNVTRINSIGWKAKISVEDGIKKTLQWYVVNMK